VFGVGLGGGLGVLAVGTAPSEGLGLRFGGSAAGTASLGVWGCG